MPRTPRPVPIPRLRSVPPADPPYDDERAPGSGTTAPPPTQGALALAYERPGPTARDEPSAGPYGPRRGFPGGSPPDERALRNLGQAMAEILAGRRPPAAVAEHLTDRAYAELVRAGTMIQTRRPPRVAVPHVNRPRDGAIEACLLVHCGERSRVIALRLERRGTQWLCTDFETA
ncbi:Rv3235 family protein [Sphaerisporangium fuscum]|uniref:Rv3235 family protein n=1 Tax=Sphaerisporangium fuscum TaxID=2835868 RepID=UPI001BDC6922|nr:Rv3235 family protein [Sphaerisporangium fuscum]